MNHVKALELEFQTIVSCHVGAGAEPNSFARASRALHPPLSHLSAPSMFLCVISADFKYVALLVKKHLRLDLHADANPALGRLRQVDYGSTSGHEWLHSRPFLINK